MNSLIQIKDLFFSYEQETILEEVNLEINKGDFVAFVGPNGSGKSTLAKLIVNILNLEQGEIRIFGNLVAQIEDWSRIGYISQKARDFNLSFPATVEELVGANLYQKMGLLKILTSNLREKVDEALDLVGILDQKKSLIGKLSGGQQQRVFIARTLIIEPEIIILDEPLVGVDLQSQLAFYELISRLNQYLGITIILISHDIEQILGRVNKIFHFRNRKVALEQKKAQSNFSYNFALKSGICSLGAQQQAVEVE